jgi:diguanylate cyclase (GGDEF)-like protein
MTSWSINRLASVFVVIATCLVLLMGGYFWLEMNQTFRSLQNRDRENAHQEVLAGLKQVDRQMHAAADNLARWDETRQQLVFPDYYQIWRDLRVRDAGMAPANMLNVALYDKQGRILAEGGTPMPTKMEFKAQTALLAREQGKDFVYIFHPVDAMPEGGLLLGYVGIKADFPSLFRQVQVYRYAALEQLATGLTEGRMTPLDEVAKTLRYGLRPNPEVDDFHSLFNNSLLRLILMILVALLAASWLLHVVVVRPLHVLSEEIDRLREHDSALPDDRENHRLIAVSELDKVRRSFNDHHTRLSRLYRDLTRSTRNFYDQARRDALTGTFNRRAFDEDWRGLGEDRRLGRVALLLFDCDHFKAINDTYGHQVGDEVIKAVTSCLQMALRSNDRLYRLGGDEFATVLTDADPQHAGTVAERCMQHVLEYDFSRHGMGEPATISIGVALSDQDGLKLSELQKRADLAMYQAKRPGNRKIQFYSGEMGGLSSLVGSREINAVFRAIQSPAMIELVYQPVLRLPLQNEEYVEALARIRADGEIVRPNAIFPIVQARNLDAEFDLAVIRAVERDLYAGLVKQSHGVSINISAASIVHTHVIDALVEFIQRHANRKIVVEVTETALINKLELASQNIQRLRAAGALVALDDFGSGYSSLRYLASMPVDLVKFDISMIRLLETGDNRQKLMIEEIASLVITAGYELVAEGIESRAMLDKIISLGFSHAQGYYFGLPVEPLAEATAPATTATDT